MTTRGNRRERSELPLVVALAQRLAFLHGFEESCDARVGRVLRTFTALARGKALDLGTGFGVSAAWMLDGLGSGRRLVRVDVEPERHERVQSLFVPYANVTLLCGARRDGLAHGPFGIVFLGAEPEQDVGPDALIDALHVGGLVVLDRARRCPWLRHPRLAASEVALSDDHALIVATRAW
ncbi:MAG: hypothetical protein H0U69_15340 [Trueperaceae bacterium]|nr:hypothetical protein [Trueperaceae bacterium]